MPSSDLAFISNSRRPPHYRAISLIARVLPSVVFGALVSGLLAVSEAARSADYAEEVRKDEPLAWWRFQDASSRPGSGAADAAGGHAAVYRGGVEIEDGVPGTGGKAARLDGTSGRIEVSHAEELARGELSVELWFRTRQVLDGAYWPASATLVSKATAGAGSGDWCIVAGSKVAGRDQGRVIAASGPRGAGDAKVISRGRLNDGSWHHVVWTRSASGESRLHIDGDLADSSQDGGGDIRNERPIHLGGDALHPEGKFLAGSLAEVAVYPRVLSLDRVRAHFEAAAAASGAPGSPASAGAGAASGSEVLERLELPSPSGLRWTLERSATGWSLGTLFLDGRPLGDRASAGVLVLRHLDTDEEIRLRASEARRIGERSARLSGSQTVGGARFSFEVEVSLRPDVAAATLAPRWSVDREIEGWEVCASCLGAGPGSWRATVYPFAGNAASVDLSPMTCVGVPSVLFFKTDLSCVVLFGIDPASDYLDPGSWTGTTGFHFKDGSLAPEYRACGGKILPGIAYELPLQIVASNAGSSARAIAAIVRDWIRLNRYEVEPLHVRAPDEALALYMKGRRRTSMWKPGTGYQLQDVWPAVYIPVSPMSAYFEYLLFEQTGERTWRDRCFEQMDFVLGAQIVDPASPLFGYIHTCYMIETKSFNSDDRGSNPGYKVDMNVHVARYMLQTWERVKAREGLDRRDWHQAAVRAVDWALAQTNPDGGLPQKLDYGTLRKSISVVSGRSLAGLPEIARITGEAKYGKALEGLERFLREEVEDRFWYTGQHPDLYPEDFESDSVWGACEYWLGKHGRTQDPESLERARGNACFAFLMLCPKQLGWVKNPTQTCHAEQLHYLQYSNYAYHNRKLHCLEKLGELTGEPLFTKLFERIVQCGFWAQVTEGDHCGAQHERMADPWKKVSREVDSRGTLYLNELSLDANLQLLEMGVMKARKGE